ncbi:Protein arginine N-methyltransferase 2 [Penicillium chermesinum]|uniref:Arginine N-methyltransferase 2 n=1 Tax=Penicillium chermesinum TaxID=63820 RepID=A0A9W9P689_9EURO|nr:Protein arginine N-methyltransferase 2 [Penicillium chermesinum]KAJ5238395.1 Protein arginine N-methyltransferase 2 [Penicillium chermesinum]KAJ6164058.1 Protein arginine N-methyltransferase 2 [Penicillium chermesinum]
MAEDPQIEITQIDVDVDVQEILLAASQHDNAKLRQLIRTQSALPDAANVKDPETGYTPLHAAISACEPDTDEQANGAANGDSKPAIDAELLQSGVNTVKFLLQEGAIWNDLDNNNETPGCLARRIGAQELYELIVDAGVRAEMLLNRLDAYEPLSDSEGEGEAETEGQKAEAEGETDAAPELVDATEQAAGTTSETLANPDVSQSGYLQSSLNITQDRILDDDQNGVMMGWEREIMRRSAEKLLPREGLKVLNVGHGMGIVDGFLQEHRPAVHHIVEAHADVVAEMKRNGWDSKPGVVIHEGRWQDILPGLVSEGLQFDAIYYDTFAESYKDFKEFFEEQVIGLLEQEGKWGFFNGMGADRQISYDVYQKVAEMDLFEAGFDVDWEDIPVPKLEGEWKGVRRAYWVVDNYRLPLCRFMD